MTGSNSAKYCGVALISSELLTISGMTINSRRTCSKALNRGRIVGDDIAAAFNIAVEGLGDVFRRRVAQAIDSECTQVDVVFVEANDQVLDDLEITGRSRDD